MDLSAITPLILTWNEEPNLRRCLDELGWADRIVVIDSGSTDGTLSTCAEFPKVEVIHRDFDNHTNQWNFGLDQITSTWVLSLDADYCLNQEFVSELENLGDSLSEVAWFVSFRIIIYGRPLRGSLYPPRSILFKRGLCRYVADGHTQTLAIEGLSGKFRTRIAHDDRKSLSRWFDSQIKYARLEAEKLDAESHPFGIPDRLRKMIWPAAPAAFLHTLILRGAIFDGWPGWFYVLQRTCAEVILSLMMLENRIKK